MKYTFILIWFTFFFFQIHTCTIFILTDSNKALFFNNEDYSIPNTCIWFRPAEKGYYDCAYVGYDNGWGQGGINTEGLAYDWVAGFNVPYVPHVNLKSVHGNPSERMLEPCATIEDAIDFFSKYRESAFICKNYDC